MKKITIILTAIAAIILALSITFAIMAVVNVRSEIDKLSASGASIIDYASIDWGYSLTLFGIAAIGVIISLILIKIAFRKIFFVFSILSLIVFLGLVFVAVRMFFQ